MYAKCLSVIELPPPFESSGLWRMWCLLSSAGIRQPPPRAFGGANCSNKKNLIDIRHPATKRINTIIIYDGLQKKIYELEKLQKIILL